MVDLGEDLLKYFNFRELIRFAEEIHLIDNLNIGFWDRDLVEVGNTLRNHSGGSLQTIVVQPGFNTEILFKFQFDIFEQKVMDISQIFFQDYEFGLDELLFILQFLRYQVDNQGRHSGYG